MSIVTHGTAEDGTYIWYRMSAMMRRYTVILTANPDVVATWLDQQLAALVMNDGVVVDHHGINHHHLRRPHIGIGVQWNHGSNAAATLQLCSGTRVLMIQLARIPFLPMNLRLLFASWTFDFVGFLNPQLLRNLLFNTHHHLQVTAPVFNLRNFIPPHLHYAPLPVIFYDRLVIETEFPHHDVRVHDWFPRIVPSPEQMEFATLLPFAAYLIARMDFLD